jgi:hypothetical protein
MARSEAVACGHGKVGTGPRDDAQAGQADLGIRLGHEPAVVVSHPPELGTFLE